MVAILLISYLDTPTVWNKHTPINRYTLKLHWFNILFIVAERLEQQVKHSCQRLQYCWYHIWIPQQFADVNHHDHQPTHFRLCSKHILCLWVMIAMCIFNYVLLQAHNASSGKLLIANLTSAVAIPATPTSIPGHFHLHPRPLPPKGVHVRGFHCTML